MTIWGWYRKSVPNDGVWRMACIPLNRGKERPGSTSSTASRPWQPYGSSDIPVAHSWRGGAGSGRETEEGSRTVASGNARWSRRGPRSGTASPMGGATPSPGASLDTPSVRRSPPSVCLIASELRVYENEGSAQFFANFDSNIVLRWQVGHGPPRHDSSCRNKKHAGGSHV